jgi:hypothetical protein
MSNRNNRKHLRQLDINTFHVKKSVTVSSECIEIDENDDAGDADAVAFDGGNLHNTCVCAKILPLDDSDGIPEWFSTVSGKKKQQCVSSSTENSVSIAMVKKLATNSIPRGDNKEATGPTIPTFLGPNVLWKNLCGISSSAILPTENVVIPTSHEYYNIILTAATRMREDDKYKSRRGLVEYLIPFHVISIQTL